MIEELDQNALEHGSMMPATPRVSDADMASCYAETAKNFMQKGWWVEAYIELHHAAEICWRNGKDQRAKPSNVQALPQPVERDTERKER